jgi:hypothetical protein
MILNKKRIVFTITPGRSGTQYLTHVLQGLPDIAVTHEPVPGFHELPPAVRFDKDVTTQFLTEKKLPYIQSFSEPTYIETSHYFCKGFVEPLLDLGVVPDLILLKRVPRKIASSWFLLGVKANHMPERRAHQHIISPYEPNFLPADHWENWNDYQICYWYAIESFFRMKHYAELITSRGGKVFETYLGSLLQDRYTALLGWLGVPEDMIAQRASDQRMRQTRINEMQNVKTEKNRQQMLAALNLDELELQVLEDCGLPASSYVPG